MVDSNENIAFEFVRDTSNSVFITGRAGTGKSTLLKRIVDETEKNVIVLAPTGIAALNVAGATIHSFFQLPHRTLLIRDKGIKAFWVSSEKRKIIRSVDTIIIDEVSMVRADVMDAIDYSLRINSGNPHLPFGGKQMVFVGDLFQLEPIVKEQSEKSYLKQTYGGPYFFNAHAFEELSVVSVELKNVYRQSDMSFVEILDKIRDGRFQRDDLDKINARVIDNASAPDRAITLTTRVDASENLNKNRLDQLSGETKTYQAVVSGSFDQSISPADNKLTLKIGAQVMFTKNDSEGRWVNGTLGRVVKLEETQIEVQLKNGLSHKVEREIWDSTKYILDSQAESIATEKTGSYKQFPVKLAWAITIHKSQGMTFEDLVLDLGEGAFANGQTYVALSRVRALTGLFLSRPIQQRDILVDRSLDEMWNVFERDELESRLKASKSESEMRRGRGFVSLGNYYLMHALSCAKAGYWGECTEYFKNAFSVLPSDSFIEKSQDYITMLRAASGIISQEPTQPVNVVQQFSYGIIYFLDHKYGEAKKIFIKVLEKKLNALVLCLLGQCLLEEKQYGGSLDCINKSIEISPSSRSYYLRAFIYDPKINRNEDEVVRSKKLFIENLISAFSEDFRNIDAFTGVSNFVMNEGIVIERLPDLNKYREELQKTEIDTSFLDGINQLLRKNKSKLIRIAQIEEDESENLQDDWDNDDSDSFDLSDVSEEELFEDELDYFDEDDY